MLRKTVFSGLKKILRTEFGALVHFWVIINLLFSKVAMKEFHPGLLFWKNRDSLFGKLL